MKRSGNSRFAVSWGILSPVLPLCFILLLACRSGGREPAKALREQVDALNGQAAQTAEKEPKKALVLARQALLLSRSGKYREGEAAALYALGDASRASDDYAGALEYYESSRSLFADLGDLTELARSLRRIGDVHYYLGDYEKATRFYLDALRIEEELSRNVEGPPPLRIGHLYTTLGNVFKATKDWKTALGYYAQALALYEQHGYQMGVAGACGNIGNLYQAMGRHREALPYCLKALGIARTLGDTYLLSIALTNTGSAYAQAKDAPRAMQYFQESLDLCSKVNRKRGVLNNLVEIGEILADSARYREAVRTYLRAEVIAEELGDKQLLSEIQLDLSRCHDALGDHALALGDFRRHVQLSGELLNAEKSKQINELRVVYETEKKEREIDLLKREKAVNERLRWALTAGIALSVLVLALLLSQFRLKARSAREIERKNQELSAAYRRVEELSRTDELTNLPNRRAIVERLEEERARFERTGRPFALVISDVDEFKRINDTLGHYCGDYVLSLLAGILRGSLRVPDAVGRWGGEEFLFILPDTDLAGGIAVAEKVRERVSATDISYCGQKVPITLTFGVSQFSLPEGVDGSLKAADDALYEGKAAGKNRVSAARAPAPS